MTRSGSRLVARSLLATSLALMLGSSAYGQNTIGGDVFAPGEADFPQSGQTVGRGPAFQFSDDFYAANGIDAAEMRRQEEVRTDGHRTPARFDAFYRGKGDVFVADGIATGPRFIDDTRITIHNMGFNAAGEMLFYPDPPAFFFESAFLNQKTKDLTNRSFVFIFPRTLDIPSPIGGCEDAAFANDFLDPGPCNRRQDNIFDTGNGYLTSNPLQLWRIMFVTWDGPDIDTPECQAEITRLAAKNGLDAEGTPLLTSVREVLNVAGPHVWGGQGDDRVLLENVLPAHGLPNPDIRGDIPGVEPEERGQQCVTVQTRRQQDAFGNPASPENKLDGPPFVV